MLWGNLHHVNSQIQAYVTENNFFNLMKILDKDGKFPFWILLLAIFFFPSSHILRIEPLRI